MSRKRKKTPVMKAEDVEFSTEDTDQEGIEALNRAEKANKRANHSIAPSMEMDELDEKATREDVKKGRSTRVTRLYIDRVDDD